MAKKKFIPRPKESERVIRKRWTKKRDSIENLSNNVQKLRYNVSLGLKNESNNEKNFLTCLVIAIMDKSFERVGNEASAANGKVGITGLNKDQVTIIGNKIILEYTGKSGVEHEKMFSDAKIAKALKIAKKNSPDENVFTTSKGFKIRNNRINRYLSDFGILSKNLRGYGANNLLVKKLSELEPEETEAKRKVQFNKVARFVAKKVGHGLPTLKKHYMIPEIEPNFIEFSKVIEIDDVSKFNDGGTVKVEEKTKKTKPSENPNVDKFTCEDAIPDSKLKKSLPQEIEDILEKDNSSFKEGGGVVKPKIVVHNNTDSASDKDAQKIIINYLKNINESGHKKFFEFLKKSNQNINDYEAVFYLSKDYYDKNVGKYYSNKIIYQKNVSDAYQNALNYDDAYPNFIRIYKHGNIKGFAATTEFDLFGDWEGDKYDDNGRLKQELKEQAIQQLKKDLYVTNNQNSGEYKMKEGGDIKNLGNDILPIGSIISVQEFRSYHKYEVVGFVEKREGSGIRYDVYELKADMSGVKGKKTQITFPYPNTKTKFRYNATIPKEGSKLISQSEIDSEKRRGSESEVVIKWEGNKPSYLMTKEEYKSIVTPKMKEFNKFISKNKEYFSKKDYYGIDYLDFESFKSIHEPSQYSTVERDFLQRSKTSEGTVPKQADEKLIKELNEYKDYFANIFGRENIKKIEDDEVGNNKRSIRRAIDSGVYEKLLREGKINYTFLKTVFDSVGINIPTKLEKIESEVVDKGITSDVQISLKEKTENFFSNLKRLFEKEIRFYADTFKEHYIESIKRMKNFCDRHKEFVNYDTFAYNYSINNNYQPTPIYENVRGIQKLKGYNYHPDIQKLYFLNKIFENSSSNESVRFFIADNWEELLEVRALDYANDLFKNFGRRILQETEVINSIDKNFPEIQNARVLRLTEKGFEANFDLKYPNGFIFSVETQVIYAGGYNIQALHLRGLFKFQYKGKFISEKELIEAYNSFSGEEKTIEKGSLIINEISIPENIDVLLKEKYTLNKDSDFYSSELMKLAGESGLVSEEVRKSNEYIRLNVKSKISFKKLQEFNESEKNKTIDDFVRKLDRVTQQKIRSHYSEEITKFEKGGEFHEWTLVIKNNETGEKFTENAVGRDINEAINNYDAQHTSILETGKYEVVSHKKGNKTVAKYSEGGEVDDDKKEGGRYSFKNDFGSFTSVFVYVPIKDKKEFLVEVTVRRKNTDGNTELKVNSKWMPIEKYDSFIEDLKERQRLSEIDKKEDGGEFESCVLQIKAKMSEGGELTIDRKKVYEGDKKLRDMSLDDVEKYIGIYHEKDGNMFFAKNKFIIWFYDTTDFANKINSGEYDFLMFPNRMKGFSFNSVGIIDEVWRAKYQNKHKGAKNLLGMVQGWYDEVNNKIIIHFMSVRPSAKRNHINSFMVQYAKKVFESTDVIFHEPTAQGYSFIESEKFEEGGDLKENSKKHTYYIQERVKWGEKTWVIMERYPYLTGFAEEEYNGEIYTDENKAKSKLDLINLLNKDKHEEGGDLKNNFKVEVIYDLLAPNGKPSNLTPEQYKLVRSPEFIAWFGNWIEDPENSSKVVDSNGEPLVVFHVTDKDFFLFDNKKSKDGFYFSANKERLKAYNKKRILEVFLNIKNPSSDEFNKNGFDGIMDFGHSENKSANSLYEIVAFESNQIKLADGTNTTFDGSNPDTRFDMGGSIISKEIWNKWLKENTNERGIAEYESNDGTEFSFDYVNSIITISRKKYPKGLDMVIKKENYSTGELSKIFKAFDERVKELVFGNKSFKLSDNKQTLIEHENNPDISFEDGGDITLNDNFNKWFKNSKVVDSKGNPLVVYHGTDTDFNSFDTNKIGNNHWQSKSKLYGGGFFFTSKKRYAHHGGIIKEVYLKIENPLIRNAGDYYYAADMYDNNSETFLSEAKNNGNDGIIINSPNGSLYIVFNPNQIKLADGTNTTFDVSNPDIRFEDGGGVSFDKVISASTRFRPTETVVFDPPLEGKNGAKLISYTWSYEWTMKPSNEGELVSKRVSDWTQAEISADTGRDIVHQYTILMPDGEYKTVSSDSVPVLLGYLDKKELKSFPNLVTASKTLAKQQMQLAILEAQKKEYDDLYAKFEKAEKPEVKEVGEDSKFSAIIESYKKGAYSNYAMGDVTYRQDNDYVYGTESYKKRPISRTTIEQLTWAWISKRVEENGGVNPRGLYDLKNRVARQKRKVENILNSKMENGGVIVGEEMADNKFPTLDEAYDIIENEESNQGGVWIAEEDSDYSEDAKFQDKEQAMLYVKEIYDFIESISDDDFIPVYRCVSAEEVDLDPYSIGESWSIYLDSAKEFGRHLGEPLSKLKIISGYVPKENVDWENAIRLYHLFSDSSSSESEFELPIPSNNKILNVTVSNFKDAKELPEYNKNYKNGGVIVGEEIKNKIIDILKTSKKYSRYNIDEAQNKEYNLINLAINQNNYFGRSVRKANENYLFIPLSIELNVGYGTDKRVDYMYFPKPNSNTKIKIVSPEPSEDSTDDEKEELKKYIKPILYDSSLVNENNELIDDRYINIFDYKELDSSVVDEEHLYRGMSSLELDNIISNKYIKSDASMNLQGQEETTSFAQYPSQASSYAFGFTAWYDDVTFENPKYVIKIKREGLSYKPALEKEPKNEVNVYGETPLSNIVDIYEIRLGVADSGSITLKEEFNGNIQEGSRSPIHKKAFVRKLSLKELEVIIGKKYNDGGDIDSNDFDDYRDYDELSGTIVGEVLDEQYYRYLDVFPQTQRFILSEYEEIKFRDKAQNAKDTFKPRGLWYAFGMDWFDAVQSVVPSYASRYNFIHTIKVTDKVCSIKTIEEAIEFTDKYGVSDNNRYFPQSLIDWSKVEKDYSGVEALNPEKWCRTEGLEGKLWWLYSWDAASGCIWKSDGIESIEPYDYKEVYNQKMKEWDDHEEMLRREDEERKKSSNHPMKKGGSMPSHYIKIDSKDGDYIGVMKFNPNNTRRVMSLADLASSSKKAGYKLIPIDSKKYDELVYNIDYEKLEKFQKDIDASDELGSDVHDLSFKKGGSLKLEDKDSIYKDWKELINMSYRELKSFYDSKEGKEAGLSRDEADDLGIHSGRESAKWILKMKHTKRNDWTDNMWEWAKRQISFVKRMSASKGELYDDNGNKTRKHTSLLIWGHNPEKHKMTFGGYVGSVDSNGTEPFIDSEGRKRFKIDDFNTEIDENKVYEVIDVVNKTQETFTLKLTDFLYNWDGYKYYPNIKNTKVRFYYNALDKINAGQDKNTGDIIINCYKIVKDYEKYIKHITSSTRMDEKTSHSKGGNGKNITEREYVLRLFRRKLFHETQHLLQLFEGIEPISTNIKDVVIYVRKKYNVEHLSLDEFEKFITEKHNLPIVSYDAAIYKEYKDIPTEKECFYVEDEIQKEYNKLDN